MIIRRVLIFCTGLLFVFPILDCWFGAALVFISFASVVKNISTKRCFITGATAGILIASSGFFGAVIVSPLLYLSIILCMSVYCIGLILIADYYMRRLSKVFALLAITVSVSALEIIISLSGWPISLSVLWIEAPFTPMLLSYVGSEWLMGILWGASVALGASNIPIKIKASIVMLFVILSFQYDKGTSPPLINVALLQTDLTQDVTDFPGVPGNIELWISQLTDLTADLKNTDVDLIVLPESVMPGYSFPVAPLAQKILKELPALPIISHHYIALEKGNLSSNITHWSADKKIIKNRSKSSPLPFIENNLATSKDPIIFGIKNTRVAPFICSESINTYYVREQLKLANIGIIVANESSVMETWIPEFHLKIERIRAVEIGKPILRASNGGLTSFIDHRGQVVNRLHKYEEGVLITEVYTGKETFFSNIYRILHAITLVAAVIFLLYTLRIKHQPTIKKHRLMPYLQFSITVGVYFFIFVTAQLQYREARPPFEVIESIDAKSFIVRQLGIAKKYDKSLANKHLFIEKTEEINAINPTFPSLGMVNTTKKEMVILDTNKDHTLAFFNQKLSSYPIDIIKNKIISPIEWINYKN